MKKLSFEEVYSLLRMAIRNRKSSPFAFARYGDGEGILLGYPRYVTEDKLRARLGKWFDISFLSLNQLQAIAVQISESVKDMDLVGVPESRHYGINNDWRLVEKCIVERKLIVGQSFCGMDCVLTIQKRRLWRSLLCEVGAVYCISCRNVENAIQRIPNIQTVKTFFLPPQCRPNIGDNYASSKKHFPELFFEAKDFISANAKGNLFLIGAGGLGKVYCSLVKQAGGVALDIGSIFDGWAGLGTRSHLRKDPLQWRLP